MGSGYVCMYVCSSHCPSNVSYMPSPACTSALVLSVVTHGTLSLTRALQLTISNDKKGIGVALHMGRGFLLFQGRSTVGLHCMVGTTHGVKQWQCTHTLPLMSDKCTMTG